MRAWLNGAITDLDVPLIGLLDHGFTVGDGVFETMRTTPGGEAFALTRHIERLRRSAAGLGLVPPDAAEVGVAVRAVLAANGGAALPHGRIRVTFTSGHGPLGSDRGPGPATLAVIVQPGKPWPEATTVAVPPWPRNERSPLVGLKTTSYAENAVALAWAKERGFSEAVMGNLAGDLCEGTGSNVFVVIDGQTMTPTLDSGCLNGITRQLVMEWGDVPERDLPLQILDTADEVFITSSTRDVHPVVAVGDRELPVGPVTRGLADLFAERSASDIDP